MLTLGSLFDGIGGWILAAKHAGVDPIWSSEIEPFPMAVTKHHFPEVVQLGDITKLDGSTMWPVDIICAGSPCQDLSVAGKQEGLYGERSGLFLDAIKLVRRMRTASGGKSPRWFVWENVPGAFSSNKGMDYKCVLEQILETEIPMPRSGKWADAGVVRGNGREAAWRVLDAQYWGVPQRRRRIFLVCDFTGQSAGEILFERESLPRDIETCGETREAIAAGVKSGSCGASVVRMRAGCAGGGKGALVSRERSLTLAANTNDQVLFVPDKARSLTARNDGSPCVDRGPEIVVAGFKAGQSMAGSIGYEVERAATLGAKMSGTEPTVVVYDMTHADEVMRKVPDGRAPNMGVDKDVSFTLNTVDRHAVAVGFLPQHKAESMTPMIEKSPCLVNGTNPGWQNAVCVGNGQLAQARLSDKIGALNCMHDQQAVMIQKSVRRLTPTECERLQGLPDGYTLIDDKTCSDTARYKALGNGMSQPCADYVIRRIVEVCDG